MENSLQPKNKNPMFLQDTFNDFELEKLANQFQSHKLRHSGYSKQMPENVPYFETLSISLRERETHTHIL